MDRILEMMEDGSVKVILHSLSCVQKIHKDMPTVLPAMQTILLPALMNVASSSNKQVCQVGAQVMKEIVASFPLQQVVQQLCIFALHDKDRLRSLAFRMLAESVDKCCENTQNPSTSNLIRKNIFPATVQTIFSPGVKGDVRVSAAEVLKAIQNCCPMGERVWTWVDDKNSQDELKRCLGL